MSLFSAHVSVRKLTLLGAAALLLVWAWTWPALAFEAGPAFHGIASKVHDVTTEDGAVEKVFELEGNDNAAQVVLLEPGYMENAGTLDGPAAEYHARGFKVLIGQVRLAGPPEFRSTGGAHDELEDVFLKSVPAHLRFAVKVARQVANRTVLYVGHSMGGAAGLAIFSDPKLKAEFGPDVASVTAINAPTDFTHLPKWQRIQLKALVFSLKQARKVFSANSMDPVRSIFDMIDWMKKSSNSVFRSVGSSAEDKLLAVASKLANWTLVDTEHTSPEAMRRLLRKELGAIPFDVTLSWLASAADGQLRKRNGELLIKPEAITIDTQMVAAGDDILVPVASQLEFFEKLPGGGNRLVTEVGKKHVTAIVADDPAANSFPELAQWQEDPTAVAARGNHVTLDRGKRTVESVATAGTSGPGCSLGNVLDFLR